MFNLKKTSIKNAYEETVKHIFYNQPLENKQTIYDLNVHLEIIKPEKKEVSDLLPIKNEEYIKKYEKQILEGVKDCEFSYTYHGRLFNYNNKINQIDYIINKFSEDLETRQAVAITLIPEKDFIQKKEYSTMPCLNELCFNIEKEKNFYMTCFFRSNDVYKALYYNMYGLIRLGKYIKENIEEKIEKELIFKRYNHEIFNAHIYKIDLKMIEKKLSDKR